LTQKLYVELGRLGHELSVEYDINHRVTVEAVEMFRPNLIVAPYLRRAIPETVWRSVICLVVHPGVVGDRGASALDWAILSGETQWGVTVLQANAEMDAGDIWASAAFPMRPAAKASLYRNEVAAAAVQCVLRAVERFEKGGFRPRPLAEIDDVCGHFRPLMKQSDRAIDWQSDDTETVLRKTRSGDGFPGVLDKVMGLDCYLFDAHAEGALRGEPGEIIAQRHGAICRATVDGAVWITHLKAKAAAGEAPGLKLPAAFVLKERLASVPRVSAPREGDTWRDIWVERSAGVAYIYFPFYNGAMSTDQCRRLEAAYRETCETGEKVIVLMGGCDFWCNGIHLNVIEAADSPADESWANINAMDDLCHAVLSTVDKLTIAAMRGNAGAGGVFMALAADRVFARTGVVLNPHYKNMGNLFGSEYWTYLLPRRVGAHNIETVMGRRLPIGAESARELGLIDEHFAADVADFVEGVKETATKLAHSPDLSRVLEDKRERRLADETKKPLEAYRAGELERLKLNFYGFDPSYHVARYNFVRKVPHSRTPLHLAIHRRPAAMGRALPQRANPRGSGAKSN
jgi:putative two-component system hydrogenase maturation factor HypX/HoxX